MTPVKSRLQEALTSRHLSTALLLVILGLFVVFSKADYQSYFSDDDFSNLLLAREIPWLALAKAGFSLTFATNIRPVGLLYYKILGATAHYHFAYYLLVLQAFHVATSFLLWLFLKRLGLRPLPAALGCLFFTVNIATLTAYWKPMYVFDVLCGFWTMMSLLFYQRRKYMLSFLFAWFAFRSKEMELMLPLLLAAYEWWFVEKHERRWKPLVPFFVMSFSFGMQSVLLNRGQPETTYSMHLTFETLWAGLVYYGSKLLYSPVAGLAISIGLLFAPSRFIRFGVIGFWTLLSPMLIFPGRQFGAYLYVPLLAFAVAIAGVAQWKPAWAMIFLLIWLPASYEELRSERNPILAFGHEHRPYVTQVLEALKAHPSTTAAVFYGSPTDFAIWGEEGLFQYGLDKWDLPVVNAASPNALETLRRPGALLFTWDSFSHRLNVWKYPGDGRETVSVDFARENPFWQLKKGWRFLAAGCQWTDPRAVITLRQPPGDLRFSLRAQARPGQTVRVSSGGQVIGEHRFTTTEMQTVNWPISSPDEAVKDFEIHTNPPYVPSPEAKPFGLMVCACGFLGQ